MSHSSRRHTERLPITSEYPPLTVADYTTKTSTSCDCDKCQLAKLLIEAASQRLGPLVRGQNADHQRLLDEVAAHFEAGLALVAYASATPDRARQFWYPNPMMFATMMSTTFNYVLSAFAFLGDREIVAAVTSDDDMPPSPETKH
jgi:hypothetical protein